MQHSPATTDGNPLTQALQTVLEKLRRIRKPKAGFNWTDEYRAAVLAAYRLIARQVSGYRALQRKLLDVVKDWNLTEDLARWQSNCSIAALVDDLVPV